MSEPLTSTDAVSHLQEAADALEQHAAALVVQAVDSPDAQDLLELVPTLRAGAHALRRVAGVTARDRPEAASWNLGPGVLDLLLHSADWYLAPSSWNRGTDLPDRAQHALALRQAHAMLAPYVGPSDPEAASS